MTGTLQTKKLKDGEYFYVVLNLYENGKRRPKWIPTGLRTKGNKKRAEQMLRDVLREYEQQEAAADCRCGMRFSDWVRQWLDEREKRLDPVTWQGYDLTAKGHILPYFDEQGTTLAEVTRPLLQAYIDQKHENGRLDGKGGLSPKSLRHIRNVLNLALKAAMYQGLIVANPCDGLILPQRVRYEYEYFSVDELNRMFDALQAEPFYPLFRVTAVYGLRLSELMGLQWDSVDFAANSLTIKHTVVKMKTSVLKDKTKTKSSYRTFPLLPDVRELLLEAKEREQEYRRMFGREYVENPYIFKWEDGRLLAPDYVSRSFSKLLKKHGLKHIRFHDLRHSCASLLIALGYTPKQIQEWLGHANISITMDVYGHMDLRDKFPIAASIAEKCPPSVRTGVRTSA